MNPLQTMAIMIEQPFLALVPAGVFIYLYFLAKNRSALIAAILWFAYTPYEYAMKFRLLCTGECNIRVDLLLIYPVLIVATLIGVIALVIGFRKKRAGLLPGSKE